MSRRQPPRIKSTVDHDTAFSCRQRLRDDSPLIEIIAIPGNRKQHHITTGEKIWEVVITSRIVALGKWLRNSALRRHVKQVRRPDYAKYDRVVLCPCTIETVRHLAYRERSTPRQRDLLYLGSGEKSDPLSIR